MGTRGVKAYHDDMMKHRSPRSVACTKPQPVLVALVVITLTAAWATVGCDAFMRLRVTVTDTSGVPVPASQATVTLPGDRELADGLTSDLGLVELTSAYGFRSGARALQVGKVGYKSYSLHIEPRPGYRCEVVLAPEATAGLSTGKCVQE